MNDKEIDAVARMAAFWNLPIIGYMAASSALADKRAYKTLARISTRCDYDHELFPFTHSDQPIR